MNGKNTLFESNDKRQTDCYNQIYIRNNPLIMGILNITPDSFFDGGKYNGEDNILKRVRKMVEEGVDIIDIGGMSTRPGASIVNEKEELERVLLGLRIIKKTFPDIPVSVDTFRSSVAKVSVEEGACIINDISGGTFDNNMFKTIARLNIPYVLMHIHGTPETMQQNPINKNITAVVKEFFKKQIKKLNSFGFEKIILDPGFGFGKSLECNYRLLKDLENLKINNLPVLVGISRKSMINKVLETNPSDALNGTTVLNTIALEKGADILRVHDVKEAVEAVKIVEFLNKEC